jgi:hypothetical protein
MFDDGLAAGEFSRDEALVGLENGDHLRRLDFLDVTENTRDALSRDLAIFEAQLEELAGELLGLFFSSHGAVRRASEKRVD